MAQIIALEWDTHEIRMISANLRGSDFTVEQATSFPFDGNSGDLVLGESPDTENEGQASKQGLVHALESALASQGISRANALVAIPRSGVEVRVLQVPTVPEDELPDIVRFQALRQFSTMGEDWPLDYISLEGSPEDETQPVLATTISPELIGEINQACESNQITPSRLVLRPFAAGSLVQRALGSQLPECYLIVELLGKEADLTVLHANQVVFMRTIRLPSDPDISIQARAISGELRRTIAAAQNQLHGTSIGQVVLCGDSDLQQHLQTTISQDLALETTSVQPFEQVSLSRSLKNALPASPERFAALLGMLQDEAASGAHIIDFLSPRKAPAPPNTRRRNLWYGIAIAACLLMALIVWFGQLSRLNQQIAELQSTSQENERFVKKGKEVATRLDTIEKFTNGNVIWLDEFSRLSDTEKFPGAEKAIAQRILMNARSEGGGRISMELHVSENAATNWGPLTRPLRDALHRVQDTGLKEGDPDNRDYPFVLNQTITVLPEAEEPKPSTRQRSGRSPSTKRPSRQ